MHDEHPHPLLAQVPLTLSPFLSLPTAIPLPYSYKALPSTLPPSILSQPPEAPQNDTSTPPQQQQQQQQQQQPAYVVSASGTSAHPDAIQTSCMALQEHLRTLEEEARRTLREWEDRRKAEDLAEKRRVAPGWLDSGVRVLKPEGMANTGEGQAQAQAQAQGQGQGQGEGERQRKDAEQNWMDWDPQAAERKAKEGEDLDRVFGGLQV